MNESQKRERIREFSLSDGERSVLGEVCAHQEFDAFDGRDQQGLVEVATHVAEESASRTPELAGAIRALRVDRDSCGLLLLRELPIVEDPKRLLALVGALLGRVSRYEGEGDYIIEIKEQRTEPGDRPSFKTSKEFYLHTDLSYNPTPPEYLLMHSISNNPDEGGMSVFADTENACCRLSALDVRELEQENFLVAVHGRHRW